MDIFDKSDSRTQKSKKYNRIKIILSITDIVMTIAMLSVLAWSGISAVIASLVSGFFSNEYLKFMAFLLTAGAGFSLIGLPLDFYGGYVLEHRFGLSNQTVLKWLAEKIKAAAVSLVLGAPLSIAFLFFLRTAGGLWWLFFGTAVILFSVVLASIAPVVIFPLFYKFKKIENEELMEKLLSLLGDMRKKTTGVYSFNMSKDTKKANAGFTGIGGSRRIILSDTLLEKFTDAEILTVFAHEVGHYRKRHILKNIAISVAVTYSSLYPCGLAYGMSLRAMGFTEVHDIAAIPILLFYLSVWGLATMPLMNWISRRFEVQADAYALEASGDVTAFISSMEKLAEINLADRDPHPLAEFLFYSHPSIKKRTGFARDFGRNRITS
ncbi:MAG: M48 family metallopeptidase [Spirochaetes bacterium]|jgi:STE24 endopeptidase|nr:M48 family metallopeptidase [Spirochaetota bacterium]